MKYTNKHNVPVEIIRAITNDQYSKGEAHISVTGLLQPPRIRLLNKEYDDKITVDYSDETWKILGQGIHAILERANEFYEDTITEQRMFAEVNGWVISGQTDSLALDENILKDYAKANNVLIKMKPIGDDIVFNDNPYQYMSSLIQTVKNSADDNFIKQSARAQKLIPEEEFIDQNKLSLVSLRNTVSELKKEAIQKLIDNVDYTQVLDYL